MPDPTPDQHADLTEIRRLQFVIDDHTSRRDDLITSLLRTGPHGIRTLICTATGLNLAQLRHRFGSGNDIRIKAAESTSNNYAP